MPKPTFHQLPKKKHDRIRAACRNEFLAHPFPEASVSNIIKELSIARGSFYQYFDNLAECYYYILSLEDIDVHNIFSKELTSSGGDLFNALDTYGQSLCSVLFREDKYPLFRNRFLYWSADLEAGWQAYLAKEPKERSGTVFEMSLERALSKNRLSPLAAAHPADTIAFIRSIIHDLITRCFLAHWDPATFLEHYAIAVSFIEGGLGATSSPSS
ncbi:hypothetical protein ABB02_01321 [Clostridiaceae bacterium JG1575]|nr:hypothetical protein ABB02_01321 [Clostridiaceae bacterium JG1575]